MDRYCTSCGSRLESEHIYCPLCGAECASYIKDDFEVFIAEGSDDKQVIDLTNKVSNRRFKIGILITVLFFISFAIGMVGLALHIIASS